MGISQIRVLNLWDSISPEMSTIRWNDQFSLTTFNFDESYYSRTTDQPSNKSNHLGKYRQYATWIFGIISPLKCPLSAETTNFSPKIHNFYIFYNFWTKDERSKKSNYLGKYRRYAFWVFGIILPLKYPLSVKTINFAPTTLNFDIPNHLCTKDERRKKSNYLGKYHRYEFWIFGIISPPKYPLSAQSIIFAPILIITKSNYLGKYHRYAFCSFGSISPLKCPLSIVTTNLAPTTLHFDISNDSSCTRDERSKNSTDPEKYHRYAFWVFRIISSPQCPLSVETTHFARTTLNFDISNYFCTKDERSNKSNYLGKYRR